MKLLKWIKNALQHLTEEPSAPMVEEPASEKTTMMETEDIVAHVRLWAIDTIDSKGKIEEIYDQLAIIDEFHEWLDINDDKLEILSLDEISEEEYDNFVDGVERS